MLDEWITAVKDELGIDLDVDTGILLDLARDAAHGVARPAAPLTTFLVGYAAAQAEGGPEAVAEAARKATALALRWAAEADDGTAPPPTAPSGTGSGTGAGDRQRDRHRQRARHQQRDRNRRSRPPSGRRMTAPGRYEEVDLDDLDVEEALALAKEGGAQVPDGSGATGGSPAVPQPSPRGGSREHGENAADGTAAGTADGTSRAHTAKHGHHRATPWPEARALAGRAPRRPDTPVSVSLDAALGLVLAAPLTALTDLPSFDTSAMDGWAVAGPGPWDVRAEGVLAGHAEPEPLTDGEAVRIATGARIPQDVTAVIRSEHGRTDEKERLHATREVVPGQDIRPRGQECRSAIPCCSAARWSPRPCSGSPRPPDTTPSRPSPGPAPKSSSSGTSCSPRACPTTD